MSYIVKDIKNFKPTNTYYLKVDLSANEYMTTEAGMEMYMPEEEGDVYQSKPFWGVLAAAPKGSSIPVGEKVYVMYQAYDTLTRFDRDDYYIVTDDLIVGWGEPDNITPYKCVLVEVEKVVEEKIITDVSEDSMVSGVMGQAVRKTPTSKGKVIASDNGGITLDVDLSVGDTIEYESSVDWEFKVNRQTRYFIRWCDRIIRCNGDMVNGYVEVTPKPKNIDRGGITLPNPQQYFEAVDGKFKGKKIFIEEKRLELGKYIKSDYVWGNID